MLRDAYKRVNAELADLVARDSPNISAGVRRAQLEQSRARLLAEQGKAFQRLGDAVSARRLRAAARAAQLSAAGDAALLRLVGKGPEAQFLYDSALQTSQRAIDAALARMRLSALPLSARIYRSSIWMGERLGKLINETLAAGLDARSFAKRARDWFNPNTPGGVRYAAMRLARTEINNAFHAMSAAKAADTPWIAEVEWHLSRAHPRPDECNPLAVASPYDSKETPARPHPQCMCYITPKPIEEDEFVENFLAGDYDDYLDAELEKNGWDVKDAAPRPDSAPPKTEMARVNPTAPNEAQFVSLSAAGLADIGSEFIYHGESRKNYLINGRRVRVSAPVVAGGANARSLVDVETGKVIGQQSSNSAKWWIEQIKEDPSLPVIRVDDRLITALKTNQKYPDDLVDKIQAHMEFSDEETGLRAETPRLRESNAFGAEVFRVDLTIRNKDGEKVGNATRLFKIDSDGIPFVDHEYIRLKSTVRGSGFAKRWNLHNEELYRELGFKEIRLNANIAVGGYAWAKQGYDFRGHPAALLQRFGEMLAAHPEWDQVAGRALLARADADDLPLPLEFAMFGWTEGAETWPGKQVMLGNDWSGWNGAKKL